MFEDELTLIKDLRNKLRELRIAFSERIDMEYREEITAIIKKVDEHFFPEE